MFRDTLLLFRLYWTLDRRDNTKIPLVGRLFGYALALMMVAFSGAAGYLFGQLTSASGPLFRINSGTIPGLLLTMALFGVLIVGINQAIRGLFLSGDLERLIVAPIHTQSVMTAKLVSRLPTTVLSTLALTVPALIGYGIGAGLAIPYFVVGTLLLLVAPLFGLAAGALIAMLLVRVLPANRLSEYLGAASILIGLLIAIAFQIPRFLGGRNGFDPGAAQSIEQIFDSLEGLPLPSMWAGNSLIQLSQGRVTDALGGILAFLLITVGLFIVTALLANRLYLSGWLKMQGSAGKRRGYEQRAGVFGGNSLDATIALKDWLLRVRDSRQLVTLFSGVVFAGVFAFLILRPQEGGSIMDMAEMGGIPDQFAWVTRAFSPGVMTSGILLFIGWSTMSQTAITALALEGKSFYILKAAPVSPRQVFRAKLMGVVAPFGVLVSLLLIASWFLTRFSPAWAFYAWLCLLIIGYGLMALSVGLGFLYPKLDWEDPRRMTTGRARLYNLISTVIFAVITGGIALIPFMLSAIWPAFSLLFVLVGLLLLVALTWLICRWIARQVENAWFALGES
ncbi:MAG: hypothetical protein U9R25_04445 [Chloroflexota bacterium]|nr:hypothetical protein [Chloroflexota bacterium]